MIDRAGNYDRVGFLQSDEAKLGVVADEGKGKFRDNAIDLIEFVSRTGENQRVGFLIDGNHDFGFGAGLLLGIGGGSGGVRGGGGIGSELLDDFQAARGHLRINILQHARHLLGRQAIDGAEAHLDARIFAGLIEFGDDVLRLKDIGATTDQRDGIGERVGFDDGSFGLGTFGEDGIELGCHIDGARILEPNKLHVALTFFGHFVESLKKLFDNFEMRLAAGEDKRVGALINGQTGKTTATAATLSDRYPLEDLVEDALHFADVPVFKFVNAHFDFAVLTFLVEFMHNFQHFLHGLVWTIDQEAVCAINA